MQSSRLVITLAAITASVACVLAVACGSEPPPAASSPALTAPSASATPASATAASATAAASTTPSSTPSGNPVASAAPAAGDACKEIARACHEHDSKGGGGKIHACHEIGHARQLDACVARKQECLDACAAHAH